MSYVTKFNARNILHHINVDGAKGVSFSDLYKRDLWLLSDREKRWLVCAKILYSDFDFFINRIYKRNMHKDTGMYISEGVPPSYHNDIKCQRLHLDYKNLEIPVEIRHRGADEILKFRSWFKENIELYEENLKRFLIRMELKFSLKNPPPLKVIEAKNSGVEEIDNVTLEALEDEIDHLIDDASKFSKQSSLHRGLITKYGYNTHRLPLPDLADSENNILNLWHNEYKKILKDKMINYFQLRFNSEIEFKGALLEQLNFRSCSSCIKSEPTDERVSLDDIPF